MNVVKIDVENDLGLVEGVVKASFSQTPDSNMDDWFSMSHMASSIRGGYGACFKAVEGDTAVGVIHAQAENLINGREGTEKWVITNLAVVPESTGKGVGAQLLLEIEKEAMTHGAKKMFVHTNKDDERVIHFYEKNGYKNAGYINDYYYDGSAVFLIKYLK